MDKFHMISFESVDSAWAYAMRTPGILENRKHWKAIQDGKVGRGEQWYGLETAGAVLETRKNGWIEGAGQIKAFADKLKESAPAPHSIRRKIKWADAGDSLDIHRVWSGRLGQAWESHPRQRSASGQQTVRIFAQVFQSAFTQASYGFWRGAAVLALADILSEAGYNVEIVGGMIAQGYVVKGEDMSNIYAFTVDIKSALAQLDISSLAATLALAGFFRVGLFMAMTNYADIKGEIYDGGHGGALHTRDPKRYKWAQDQMQEKTGQSWDFDATECGDERAAAEWVKQSIAKLQGDSNDF